MTNNLYYLELNKANNGLLLGYVSKVLHIYDKTSFLARACDSYGSTKPGYPARYHNTEEEKIRGNFFDSLPDLRQYAESCGVRVLDELQW